MLHDRLHDDFYTTDHPINFTTQNLMKEMKTYGELAILHLL